MMTAYYTLDYQHAATPLIHINGPFCQALISFQGAQLLQFSPKNQRPWLYCPSSLTFLPNQAIEAGIPICLPWFGRHANAELPIHGTLRQRLWQLSHIEARDDAIQIQFDYQHRPDRFFAYPFRVSQRLILSQQIELQLSIDNPNAIALPISFAWHSYFNLTGSAHIEGLTGLPYFDYLHQQDAFLSQAIKTGAPIDAVFSQTRQAQILQQSGQRLHISGHHCPSCIVWQPQADSDFICIERGAAFADSLQINAHSQWHSQMTIRALPC